MKPFWDDPTIATQFSVLIIILYTIILLLLLYYYTLWDVISPLYAVVLLWM